MRVFYLSFLSFDFSNIISQIEVAKHLSRRNNEVYLFATGSKENYARIYSDLDLILIRLKFIPIITPLLYVLTLLILMPFYIIVKRPNYIITEKGTCIVGLVWRIFFHPLNLKVIVDIRSTPIKTKTTIRRYMNELLFQFSVHAAKKLDGLTTLTESMKKEICNKFKINPSFVGVWTSGVSAELFNDEKYDSRDMREKLGLTNKFILFYHGALAIERGIAEVIKSIALLKDSNPDLVLFLLGSNSSNSEFRNLVRKLGVQNNVIIHDKVDYSNVPKFIAMCDVGIIPLPNTPDWRHQCPLKLLEYLAMRKVIIATNIPAISEILGKSKCGIYISSVELQEIAKAIMYTFENRSRLKEWGAYGKTIIERGYTWEKVAEDLEKFLLNLQ